MQKNNKTLLLLALTFTTSAAFSQHENTTDDCEEGTVTGLMTKLAEPPKCVTDINRHTLSVHFKKSLDSAPVKKFCETCKTIEIGSHEKKTPENNQFLDQNRKDFTKAALNELRKNLSQTLSDIVSMRSTISGDFDADSSIKACNINKLSEHECKAKDGFKGKSIKDILSSTIGNEDSLQKVQTEMGFEIYDILNGKQTNRGLLKRKENACSISDNEFLHAKARYLETLITPDLIAELAKIDFSKSTDIFATIYESDLPKQEVKKIKQLRSHMFMNGVFKDPKLFRNFLSDAKKSIASNKALSPEIQQEKILEQLFKKENGNILNKEIESRCSKAFEQIKTTLCSQEFKNGNLLVDESAFNLTRPYSINGADKDEIPLTTLNRDVAQFCHGINTITEKPITLNSVHEVLASNINGASRDLNFTEFQTKSYEETFTNSESNLCKYEKAGSCDAKKDKDCEFFQIWQKTKLDLNKHHDKNINQILGSFLGAEPKMKGNNPAILAGLPRDKEGNFINKEDQLMYDELVKQGIVPKSDGTHVVSEQKNSSPSSFSRDLSRSSGGGSNVAGGPGDGKPAPTKFKPQETRVANAANTSYGNYDPDADNDGTGDGGGSKTPKKDDNGTSNTVVNNSNAQFDQNFMKKVMNGAGRKGKKPRNGNLREIDGQGGGGDTTYSRGGAGNTQNYQVGDNGTTMGQQNDEYDYQATNLNNKKSGTPGGSGSGYVDRDKTLMKTMYGGPGGDVTGVGSGGNKNVERVPANEGIQTIELPAIDAALTLAEQEKAIQAGLEAQGQLLKNVQETQPDQFAIKINSHSITIVKGTNGLYSAVPAKGIPQHYVDTLNKRLAELLKRKAEYNGLKGNFQTPTK